MKIAIFAIFIISMGIMISASPDAHASDLSAFHSIDNINHHLNDSNIQDNCTTSGPIVNPLLKNNMNNITSMPIDQDNNLL